MRIYSLLIATIFLTSCAYTIDTAQQEIEVQTPGARNAVCYTYIDDVRYRIHPPQKIVITKSHKDLELDCLAPGNRRNKVFIEPKISDAGKANILTAGAGAFWDFASKSLYEYPEIIYVDFTHTPVQPMPLPAQNELDIRPPEDYPLEQFSPGSPRLNEDSYEPYEIRLRERAGQSEEVGAAPIGDYQTLFGEGDEGGKGELQDAETK
ncbi:MAG: hypothetical protein ACRBCT_07640 [Alphaproteobacteria bacterium]